MAKEKESLLIKGKTMLTNMHRYYYVPNRKKNRYVPYREWLAQITTVGGDESAAHARILSWGAGSVFASMIYGIPMMYFTISGLITMPLGYFWSIINNMLIGDNLGFLSRKSARIIKWLYVPLFIIGMIFLIFVPTSVGSSIMPGMFKLIGINLVMNIFPTWYNMFWRRLLLMKMGRFKPFQYINTLPYIITFCMIVYTPFDKYDMDTRFWVMSLYFSIHYMFGVSNVGGATNNCSPNEQERMEILAWPGTVANGINSIFGFLVPALGTYFSQFGGTQGLEYLRAVPLPFMLAGWALQFLMFHHCHERIVMPQVEQKPDFNFWTGADAAMRNKYKWLQSVAGVIDSLGNGTTSVMGLVYTFILRDTGWITAFFTKVIIQTAVTPGYILAPLWNKIEYRKLYFISMSLSLLISSTATIALFFGVTDPNTLVALVLVTSWLSELVGRSRTLVDVSLGQNLDDYQSWISGERLGGFSGILGWFTGPVITVLSMMVPAWYLSMGYTQANMDILFNDDVRTNVIMTGFMISFIGDVLRLIPMIWFNFSKPLQKQIIRDLRWRLDAAEELKPINDLSREGKAEEAEALLAEVVARREAEIQQ
jgi:hypothetical protein